MDPIVRADAGALLTRALIASACAHGLAARLADSGSHPWSSATFVGARHRLVLEVEGDARAWAAALPEAELRLRGHLVADLAVARAGMSWVVDALTVTEA